MQSGIASNNAPVVARIGVQQSLAIPGLVTPPPVSGDAQTIAALSEALSGGALIARQYTEMEVDELRRREQARRVQLAEQDRLDREAQTIDRGLASRAARTKLPDLQRRIAEEIIVPVEGETTQDVIERTVGEFVANQSPAFEEQFRDIAEPALAGALVQQEANIRSRMERENLVLLGESIAAEKDPVKARATFESARAQYPRISDTEYLAASVGNAIKIKARAGDAAGVAAMADIIGPQRLPEERAEANALLAQAKIQQEAKTNDDYRQRIANRYVQGAPFDIIEEDIRSGDGTVDPTIIKQQLDELAVRRRQSVEGSNRDAIRAFDNAATEERINTLVAASRTSMYSSEFTLGKDVEITRPDGSTLTIPFKQVEPIAIDRAMSAIAREEAPRDASPEEAAASGRRTLARQTEYLGLNGKTYEPWNRIRNAGYLTSLSSFRATDGKDVQIPANLEAAVDLQKRLNQINPRFAAAGIDTNARMFYDLIDLAETYATPGDRPAAIMMAMKATAGGLTEERFSTGVAIDRVREAMDESDFASVNNRGEIEQTVRRVANFYVATGIVGDPAIAIEKALEKVTGTLTSDGAYAIDLGPINAPENFPDIARSMAEVYAAKYGEEEGLDSDDISIAPGETSGTFILFNTATNQPVENWATEGIYTMADINNFARGQADDAKQDVIKRVLAKSQARNNPKGMVEWTPGNTQRLRNQPDIVQRAMDAVRIGGRQ
jgi:hypothetical protein